MQKRTAAITLAVLGAIALSTGCSEQKPPTTYTSVSECVSDGNSTAECQKALADVTAQTEKDAPKFTTQDQCQAQFGNCQKSSSGDWFMPAVAGYMLGSIMNNGSRAAPQPVYIDRDRRPMAASYSGGVMRTAPAPQSYTSRVAASRSAPSTSSRGGFGSRASSSSSFGG